MKILLDPLIYWFEDDKNKEVNLQYWNKVTRIIEKYFDIRYVSSKSIIQTLQRLNKEPFNFGKEHNALKQQLIKRILLNLDYPNNINDDIGLMFNFPQNFQKTKDSIINDSFATILTSILENQVECILLLSLPNHQCDLNNYPNLFVVRHISGEINSKITELIKNREYLKENIVTPTLKSPLPFYDLCDNFQNLQNQMKKKDDDISVFVKITKEVAFRNLYTFDDIVTNKNNSNKHKRKIYTYNKNHYISADFETGCFELCDHRGRHQKEISYIGKELSPRDEKGWHDIEV